MIELRAMVNELERTFGNHFTLSKLRNGKWSLLRGSKSGNGHTVSPDLTTREMKVYVNGLLYGAHVGRTGTW